MLFFVSSLRLAAAAERSEINAHWSKSFTKRTELHPYFVAYLQAALLEHILDLV